MKKYLILMWTVIIIGGTFLLFHFYYSQQEPITIQNQPNVEIKDTPAIDLEFGSEDLNENLKLGDQALLQKDIISAIKYYQKALNLEPNSAAALEKLANAYLQNSENEKAKELLIPAIKAKPQNQDLQILLVRSQINTRELQTAKSLLNNISDQNIEKHYYLSIVQILEKDLETANKTLNTIISQENSNKEVKEKAQNIIKAFETFSYYKEGETAFRDLLIAKAFVQNHEYSAAIPILFQIISEHNNYRDAWLVMGYAYLNTNNAVEAIDALNQAKDLDPEKAETLFFLGLAYFANDQILQAINYIEKADSAGYEPKEQIQLKLGDLYLLQEEYQKSSDKYEELLSNESQNLELYVRTVWLNIEKLDNYEKALLIAESSAEQFPENAMPYNLIGWAYTALGDYDQAKANLEKSLEINPDLDSTHLNIAWLYQQQDFKNIAKEYYKKAYILGQGNSVSTLAAQRFNQISEEEAQRFYQTNITAPSR